MSPQLTCRKELGMDAVTEMAHRAHSTAACPPGHRDPGPALAVFDCPDGHHCVLT